MTELDDYRAAKDDFFRRQPDSPLTPPQRASFDGLRYFLENPALVFEASVAPFEEHERVEMQTSTGDTAEYVRLGRVQFEVDGEAAALTVFGDPASGALFVPFRDATSGRETYAAGR